MPKGLSKKPRKLKYPPLTSETQLQDTVRKRNATNKRRSKDMERRIARTLRGRRVPMSGAAAQYKGDVEIPFVNFPGKYIIECKLSSQKNEEHGSFIVVKFEWLPKLHAEVISMSAKFGVLIINFLGSTRDYVFVRRDIVDMLLNKYRTPYADVLVQLVSLAPLIDVRETPNHKIKVAHRFIRDTMDKQMVEIAGMKGVRYMLPDAEYLVIHLDTFNMLLEHT
jgi:hypothetical protein